MKDPLCGIFIKIAIFLHVLPTGIMKEIANENHDQTVLPFDWIKNQYSLMLLSRCQNSIYTK